MGKRASLGKDPITKIRLCRHKLLPASWISRQPFAFRLSGLVPFACSLSVLSPWARDDDAPDTLVVFVVHTERSHGTTASEETAKNAGERRDRAARK
jgi:hypothetical protein